MREEQDVPLRGAETSFLMVTLPQRAGRSVGLGWWAVIASSFLALHVQTSLAANSQQKMMLNSIALPATRTRKTVRRA